MLTWRCVTPTPKSTFQNLSLHPLNLRLNWRRMKRRLLLRMETAGA
jgi:hypothetical protein